MALIQCSECGENVSTKAEKCPHCGAPVEPPIAEPEKRGGCFHRLLVIVGVCLLALLLMGGLLAYCSISSSSTASSTPAAIDNYAALKATFEAKIADRYAELLAAMKAGNLAEQGRVVGLFERFKRQDYRDVAVIAKNVRAAEKVEKEKKETADALSRLSKTPANDIKNLAAIYAQLKELHPDNTDYVAKAARYGAEWTKQAAILAEKQKKEAAEQARIASRKKTIEEQFNNWDGSHTGLERIIKRTMHNPDSYKHVETRYSDMGDYIVVGTTFRGTNAFGAVVTNTVRAKFTLGGEFIEMLDQ